MLLQSCKMRTGSTQEVEVTYEWGKPERLHERGSAGAGYWSLERTRRYFGPKRSAMKEDRLGGKVCSQLESSLCRR